MPKMLCDTLLTILECQVLLNDILNWLCLFGRFFYDIFILFFIFSFSQRLISELGNNHGIINKGFQFKSRMYSVIHTSFVGRRIKPIRTKCRTFSDLVSILLTFHLKLFCTKLLFRGIF